MKHLAIMGFKKTGKTFLATKIIEDLVGDGYRVAAVKHVHHEFTIDTEGKDTWRMARSGASIVTSISPNEMAIIFPKQTHETNRDELLGKIFQEEGIDVVVYEGFAKLYGGSPHVYKILTVRKSEDIGLIEEISPPVVAVFRLENTSLPEIGVPVYGPELSKDFFNHVRRSLGLVK